MTKAEAHAWFSIRAILSPRRHMEFVVTWSVLSVLLLSLGILNVAILQNSPWWLLYYGGLGSAEAYLAHRNYQNYRIAKIRKHSAVPEWFKDACLSYWVWARDQRAAARRQWLSDVIGNMGKGIGLDRRR